MADLTVGENLQEFPFSLDVNAAPQSYTTTIPDTDFSLSYISLRANGTYGNKVAIEIDSVQGANYDTEFFNERLDDEMIFAPDSKFVIKNGNQIKVTCPQKTGITIYGIVVIRYE